MQCQPTISNEFIELLAVCFVALQFSNFKEPMNHMYSTKYTHLKIYRRQFIIKTSAIRTKRRTDVEEMSRQFICIRFVTMPANIHACIRWVFITFALVSHLFEVNRCESSCFSRCNQTFITHIKTRKLNTSASLVTDNKETCNTNTHTHTPDFLKAIGTGTNMIWLSRLSQTHLSDGNTNHAHCTLHLHLDLPSHISWTKYCVRCECAAIRR